MPRTKFFTDLELTGMTDDICFKLDRARDFFGAPMVLTCGFRTVERNAEIGGVQDSEHTYGRAADIRAPSDPAIREKMMWAFGAAGFRRVESAPKHFHVDISPDKISPCFWEGDDH